MDPRVASAISHWAPRFVANGVPLTDFDEVTAGVTRWEDWCAAWCARGAIHETIARETAAEGYRLSAAQHYTRAAVCFHFAKFVFVNDYGQMKAAHLRAVACRNAALPWLNPPGERVEMPYAGGKLYGNLRKPVGVAKPPVVVMCMGLDSAKEEMDSYESLFLARGVATLAFDGPGQGEGEYDFPICPEYEQPVAAVFDYVGTRTDLDADRVGIWGVSLGGYYAPRAAAYEKRAKACIALSGPYDWGDAWEGLPPLTKETFRVRARLATMDEAKQHASRLTLKEAAGLITCPLYVMAGKEDRIVPWQDGEKLAKSVRGAVHFELIEDGNHVANNRGYRYRSQSADWMATQLGVPRA